MNTATFRKSLFARIVTFVVIVNFIFTTGPVGVFADTETFDTLRSPSANSKPPAMVDISSKLLATKAVGDVWNIDEIASGLVLTKDPEEKKALNAKIRRIAERSGIFSASIHDLYMARGRGEVEDFVVPAINIREKGISYDFAREIFRRAKKLGVAAFIFEIAKSEIDYTDQRPAEFTGVVLAAAIKEGWQGPVFIQGDHFQVNAKAYAADPKKEIDGLKALTQEAIEAGFFNIDIDASTIVDLSKPTLEEQQFPNAQVSAEMTRFIRGIEPRGVTVSIGGELGEIGGKNTTVEELDAFDAEYKKLLPKRMAGLSKISVQTGASHGGVVLADGSIKEVSIDFDTLRALSERARKLGMGGAVQHGASTLPEEAFDKFQEVRTLETHLATGFQNIIYDSKNFPLELRNKIYNWIKKNLANERKPEDTEEQFIYKSRKKGFAPFYEELMNLPEATRTALVNEAGDNIELILNKFNAGNTREVVAKNTKLVNTAGILRVGVLTSGGPATGHNAVLYGNIKENEKQGIETIAIWYGWDGLSDPELVSQARLITSEEIKSHRDKGGTILGTDRGNPYSKESVAAGIPEIIWQNVQSLGLDALIILGGNDSQGPSYKFKQEHPEFLVIGGAKTMDNDLALPEPDAESYGFRSFVRNAIGLLVNFMRDLRSTRRVGIVEIFGRNAGHAAAHAGADVNADLTFIPELGELDLEKFINDVKRAQANHPYKSPLVIVAEGVSINRNLENNYAILEKAFAQDIVAKAAFLKGAKGAKTDAYGNPKLENIKDILAAVLRSHGVTQLSVDQIKYVVRSADASESEANDCEAIGTSLTRDYLLNGIDLRVLYSYNGEVRSIPLTEDIGGRGFDLKTHKEILLKANRALSEEELDARIELAGKAKEETGQAAKLREEEAPAVMLAEVEVDELLGDLLNNLPEIVGISPQIRDFLDLFLIKAEARIDPEQVAALRSKLLRVNNPDSSVRRVAIFGDNQVSREGVREVVGSGYDELELVALVGKSAKEMFPILVRDSRFGAFPGRCERAGDELFYLGDQKEAVRVFSEKDFPNLVEDFPWEALALDVVVMDEAMYKKIGKKAQEALKAKGIQLAVSRTSGEGLITYVPGAVNEAELQNEAAISIAATDEVAVVLGAQVLSGLGEIQWLSTNLSKALGGQIPATYRLPGAHQDSFEKQDLYSKILYEKLGLDPLKVAPSGVVSIGGVRRGQVVELTASIAADVSKDDVIAAFTKAAQESRILALPEEGVELTSNLVWGEKRIFFDTNPGSVYVSDDGKSGGKQVTVFFFIDEDAAHVEHILAAISKRASLQSSTAAGETKPAYAASEIMAALSQEVREVSEAKKQEEAEQKRITSESIEAAKTKVRTYARQNNKQTSGSPEMKLLFPGVENLPKTVSIIYGEDGKKVGVAFSRDNQLVASSLLKSDSPEETQKTLTEYYAALRKRAMELSQESGNMAVEVVDNYRLEENLRVRFEVSATDPTQTTYKSLEQLIGGEWVALSEPNMKIDPREFEGKYTVAINAPGGRIGSLWIKLSREKPNLRIIAVGGPEAEPLAEFLERGDYIQGRYPGEVGYAQDQVILDGKNAVVFSNRASQVFREPVNYPWNSFIFAGVPVDVVFDATGKFLSKAGLESHLWAGSGRSLASAPGKEDFPKETNTFVLGINDHNYNPEQHFIASTASCTTGCLAMLNRVIEIMMLAKKGLLNQEEYNTEIITALDEAVTGFMTTFHVPTSEKIGPDTEAGTRKRDISDNILLTTTGAAKNIGLVNVAPVKMDGLAVRFPGDVGSLVDAHYTQVGTYTKEDVIAAARLVEEATGRIKLHNVKFSGQIRLLEEIRRMMATIGPDNIHVVHYTNTNGQDMTLIELSGWYENEYYYAGEAVDFVDEVMRTRETRPLLLVAADGQLQSMPRADMFAQGDNAVRGADKGYITAAEHEVIRRVLARLDARNSRYTNETLKDDFGKISVQIIPGLTQAIRREALKELGYEFVIYGHNAIREGYTYLDADACSGPYGMLLKKHETDEILETRASAKKQDQTLKELVEWLDERGNPEEVKAFLLKRHENATALPKEAKELVADVRPSGVTLTAAQQRPVRGAAAGAELVVPNEIPRGGKLTVGGNWKLRPFESEEEARTKAREFKDKFADIDKNAEIVLFVEDKWINAIAEELQGSNIRVGVQSFHFNPKIVTKPHIIEETRQQIEDAISRGAKYAMIGHSMHRNPDRKVLPGVYALDNETANIISRTILQDGRLKLWYVIAVNEEPNKTTSEQEDYIKRQIDEGVNMGLDRISEDQLADMIITVEPTADISTKAGDGWIDPKTKVNFPKVELLARLLNETLIKKFGSAAEKLNTGYGASASPDTAATLLSHPNVFNILPGGKSLEADDFYVTVVNAIIGKYGSHKLADASERPVRGAAASSAESIGALTIDDIGDIAGRYLLVRPDLNAPVKDGQISLTDRIIESAKTIREVAEKNARVVIIAHQGRVGDADYLESMEQHAQLLAKEMGRSVKYVHDLYGKNALEAILSLKDGEILMLKNLRPEEADPQFVANLEPLFYAFINDAFSVSHRKQPGVVGFSNIPNIAGRLMQRELEGNSRFLTAIQHPYIELLGGAKISDHLDALRYGLDNGLIDRVLTGGLLGQLLLLIDGYELGEATREVLRKQDIDEKKRPEGLLTKSFLEELNSLYAKHKDKFELPIDLAYTDEQGVRKEILIEDLPKAGIPFLIADNGTKTAEKYASISKDAKTVFEKGPMGNYKQAEFLKGSEIPYRAIAENASYWMTGGGDTDVLNQELGLTPTHRTLAGGAYLEFKAGKVLSGLEALQRSKDNILHIEEACNVDKQEILTFVNASKTIRNATGGDALRGFVDSLQENPTGNARGLVVSSNYLRIPGAREDIIEATRLSNVRLVLFGDNAEKMKALLTGVDVIAAENLDNALTQLARLNITSQNTLLLRTPEDVLAKKVNIRQVVAERLSTLAMAKALKELFGESSSAAAAFEMFFDKLMEARVISKETHQNRREDVLAELEESGVFEFPDDLEATAESTKSIESESRTYEEFIIKI